MHLPITNRVMSEAGVVNSIDAKSVNFHVWYICEVAFLPMCSVVDMMFVWRVHTPNTEYLCRSVF